jgi:hypothetical protein
MDTLQDKLVKLKAQSGTAPLQCIKMKMVNKWLLKRQSERR